MVPFTTQTENVVTCCAPLLTLKGISRENAHPMIHIYVTSTWHTSRIRILSDMRYSGTAGEVEGIFRLQTPRCFGRRSHLSLWHGETRDGRLAHGSGYSGESPGEWLVPCKSWRVGRVMVVRAWNVHNLGIPLIELLWPVEFVLLLYTCRIMQNCRLEEGTLDPWHTFAASGWGIHFQPMKLWSTLIIFELAWQLPSPIWSAHVNVAFKLGEPQFSSFNEDSLDYRESAICLPCVLQVRGYSTQLFNRTLWRAAWDEQWS